MGRYLPPVVAMQYDEHQHGGWLGYGKALTSCTANINRHHVNDYLTTRCARDLPAIERQPTVSLTTTKDIPGKDLPSADDENLGIQLNHYCHEYHLLAVEENINQCRPDDHSQTQKAHTSCETTKWVHVSSDAAWDRRRNTYPLQIDERRQT